MNIVIPLHFEVAIPVWIVLLLAAGHFLADFVLQSDEMALNKATDNSYLFLHVATYTIPMAIIGLVTFPVYDFVTRGVDTHHATSPFAWLGWVIANFVLHFATDWVTSRRTKHYHSLFDIDKTARHKFFVVIGFDQLLHTIALLLTTAAVLA